MGHTVEGAKRGRDASTAASGIVAGVLMAGVLMAGAPTAGLLMADIPTAGVLVAGAPMAAMPALAASAAGQAGERQLSVRVTGRAAQEAFTAGEPILVDVVIANDMPGPVSALRLSSTLNDWNGEAAFIELEEIRRLPSRDTIFLGRPVVRPPPTIAGPASDPIAPGTSSTRRIDLAKWSVTGGWVPDRYEIVVRVEQIRIDGNAVASITSDPFAIEIR